MRTRVSEGKTATDAHLDRLEVMLRVIARQVGVDLTLEPFGDEPVAESEQGDGWEFDFPTGLAIGAVSGALCTLAFVLAVAS